MVAYESLKRGKVQLVDPKSGRGQELFIKKQLTESQFKWGVTKAVVTRAGRLRELSQGELRLYLHLYILKKIKCIYF